MFKFKDILAIILGAGIFSFGIYFLVIPFHFYEGGATGITLITYYLFKIPCIPDELADQYPSLRSGLETAGQKSLYLSLLGTFSVSAWMAILKPCPSATTTITLSLQPLKEIFCLPVSPQGLCLVWG